MPARPKGQPPTVTLICPVGDHRFTVPYKDRTRRFCSHQHANVYHGARRGDAPEGYATIAMLAARYGYSRAHIERLVGGGLVEAEFRDGHYLISAAAEARAKARGIFERGRYDKASVPLVQVKSRRGRNEFPF